MFTLSAGVALLAAGMATRGSGACTYGLCGVALAAVLNAVVPHLLYSFRSRSYMPGTGTAWLLNVPLGSLFLYRAAQQGQISVRTFFWFGPCVVLALLLLVPALLFVGRKLSDVVEHR